MTKPDAMQATKWLKVQLLIDEGEMQNLLTAMGEFDIYISGAVTHKGEGHLTKAQFLKIYKKYVASLQEGKLPAESDYRQIFSAVFTQDPEALFSIPVGSDRQLMRIAKPVIQLQPHSLGYSQHDNKFRAMVFGTESILWGLQFSYPQLYQDPKTKEALSVDESPQFPNTSLFKNLQRWIRHHTIPTPFLVEGHKINVPMRLGNRCLSWINTHPQLKKHQIQVFVP